MNHRPAFLNPVVTVLLMGAISAGCSDSQGQSPVQSATMTAPAVSYPLGDFRSPITFSNPYAHIPAQCHIETSRGTQNACLFCHTNGVYQLGLGNNFPQAGAEPRLGNLQLEYSFTTLSRPGGCSAGCYAGCIAVGRPIEPGAGKGRIPPFSG